MRLTSRTRWTPRARDAVAGTACRPARTSRGGPGSGFAQAPAAIAAFDEAVADQPAQAAQHGVEIDARLDRDRRGSRATAGGQRVEHPGTVRVQVVAGRPAAGIRIRR